MRVMLYVAAYSHPLRSPPRQVPGRRGGNRHGPRVLAVGLPAPVIKLADRKCLLINRISYVVQVRCERVLPSAVWGCRLGCHARHRGPHVPAGGEGGGSRQRAGVRVRVIRSSSWLLSLRALAGVV
jgi:hypothetical protein